jgi:WD40 repeat protein
LDSGAVAVFSTKSADPKQWTINFQKFVGPVSALALHDDRIAVAADREVTIWNLARQELVTRIIHEKPVLSLQFSEDGKYLATSGGNSSRAIIESEDDYVTEVWLLNDDDLVQLACSRTPRNINPETEWARYMTDEQYHETCPQRP